MARRLGIPDQRAHGERTPAGKAEIISTFDARQTMMIGDGANDSLAFDAAGCRGTPVIDRGFLEHKADFYFLGSGIRGIRLLFEVGTVRKLLIRRVFAFALAYNVSAVSLSLCGLMNPLLAAILMPVSSLISLALAGSGFPAEYRPAAPGSEPEDPSSSHGDTSSSCRFQLADRKLMC
jgi:Cu2+-exporting ATPase